MPNVYVRFRCSFLLFSPCGFRFFIFLFLLSLCVFVSLTVRFRYRAYLLRFQTGRVVFPALARDASVCPGTRTSRCCPVAAQLGWTQKWPENVSCFFQRTHHLFPRNSTPWFLTVSHIFPNCCSYSEAEELYSQALDIRSKVSKLLVVLVHVVEVHELREFLGNQ